MHELNLLLSSSYHAHSGLPPNMRSSSSMSMTVAIIHGWLAESASSMAGPRTERSETSMQGCGVRSGVVFSDGDVDILRVGVDVDVCVDGVVCWVEA